MKRFQTRSLNKRNAGLLAPSIYQGTVYRQPWDRLNGIKDGHDRETIVAALTAAIASDISNVDQLPVTARQLGTGEDVTETSHFASDVDVDGVGGWGCEVVFDDHGGGVHGGCGDGCGGVRVVGDVHVAGCDCFRRHV